jgi:hypothetical protein
MLNTTSEIKQILSDPCSSFWLKQSIERLLSRDIVDAAHDAQKLADIMQRRCTELLARG